MSVVILINGCEAIPVRAIPFVTGWWMSPDVVAKSFAHPDSWQRMGGDVPAYQLHGGAICGPLLPKEWDGVEDRLQGLEAKLKAMSDDRTLTRPVWLRKSIPMLPPNVFVWKDQFERYFYREYSPQRLYWMDERPGDRELNFSPLISPPEMRDVVMKGFKGIPIAEGHYKATDSEEQIASSSSPTDGEPRSVSDAASIQHEGSLEVCNVDDEDDIGGFVVKRDGLYMKEYDKHAWSLLTPSEQDVLSWHPTGEYDKPALPLPCTPGQLRLFAVNTDLDKDAIGELLAGWRQQYKDLRESVGRESENVLSWYDQTLDAMTWWNLSALTPHEAAMLLCHVNPHDDKLNPLSITTEETAPEDFKRLLRVFEDEVQTQSQARTLREWHDIARDKRLKYHSWIDAFRQAVSENAPTTDTPPRVSAELPEQADTAPSGALEKAAPEVTPAGDAEHADTLSPTTAQEQSKTGEQVEVLRKRQAFVAEFVVMWPTIEGDLRDGSRSGLSAVANDKHGYWRVGPALNWAAERGKIQREKAAAFVRAEGESETSVLVRAILDSKCQRSPHWSHLKIGV